jgi:hypothetical protein
VIRATAQVRIRNIRNDTAFIPAAEAIMLSPLEIAKDARALG